MSEFKCSICGKQYSDLTAYVNCVTKCAAAKSKENELNKMLKCVEDARDTFNKSKEYLDLRLKEFKTKFPKEYAEYYPILMPSNEEECEDECKEWDCDGECNKCICNEEHGCHEGEEKSESLYKVNGKSISKDEFLAILKENPGVEHLAKTLGILEE